MTAWAPDNPVSRPTAAWSGRCELHQAIYATQGTGSTFFYTASCYPVQTHNWPERITVRRDLGRVAEVCFVEELCQDGYQRASALIVMQDGRHMLLPWEQWYLGIDSMKARNEAEQDEQIEEVLLF